MKNIFIFLVVLFQNFLATAQYMPYFNDTFSINGSTTSSATAIEENNGYTIFHSGTKDSTNYRIIGLIKLNHKLEIVKNTILDSSANNIDFLGSLFTGFYKLSNESYYASGMKINRDAQYSDGFTIFYDPMGNLIKVNYHKHLGSVNLNSSYPLSDTSIMIAGPSQNMGFVAKVNTNGQTLWSITFGDGSESVVPFIIRPGLLPNTHAVYGWRGPISGTMVHSILVIDSLGNPLLEKSFPSGFGGCMGETSFYDSTFVIAGIQYHSSTGLRDPIIRKINREGNIIWEKIVKTPYEWAHFSSNIVIENDGRIICAGREQTLDGFNCFLMAFSASGDSLWRQTYKPYANAYTDQQFYNLIKTSDGGYLMSGHYRVKNYKLWLLKVDSLGCEEYNCAPANVQYLEEQQLQVKVYPNPSNGQLFIETAEQKPLHFNVFDLQGRSVYSGQYQGNGIVLPSHLRNGIYLLQLEYSEGIHRQKFVLQR